MTTSLLIRFPWGRYHANPWGAHVNEARVELPPSPWRLLRALYSTWKVRRPDVPEDDVIALLQRLAEPPVCHVPPHTVATTRHYYPDSTHRRGVAGATDLTLDTFATIDPDEPIAFHWPFDLDATQRHVLEALAASTPYFGRAESICEVECTTEWTPPRRGTYVPADLDDFSPQGSEVVDLLSPTLPLDLDSLLLRPVDVRRRKLRFPEGARLVPYRAVEPLPAPAPPRPSRPRRTKQPVAVRLAIVGPVLPPLTDAVNLGDRLRQAALSRLGRSGDRHDSYLAGRTAGGALLREAHRHAHYLPVVTDRRVTDLLVWVPAGLDAKELAAVEGIRFIWSESRFAPPRSEDQPSDDQTASRTKIELRATAIGPIGTVAPELVGPSAHWVSLTPYASPRHQKGDEGAFLAQDVRSEVARRPDLSGEVVSVRSVSAPSGFPAPVEFVRARPSKRFARAGGRAPTGGFGPGQAPPVSRFLELEFGVTVNGPIALGHLSHFGLGLFVPTVE